MTNPAMDRWAAWTHPNPVAALVEAAGTATGRRAAQTSVSLAFHWSRADTGDVRDSARSFETGARVPVRLHCERRGGTPGARVPWQAEPAGPLTTLLPERGLLLPGPGAPFSLPDRLREEILRLVLPAVERRNAVRLCERTVIRVQLPLVFSRRGRQWTAVLELCSARLGPDGGILVNAADPSLDHPSRVSFEAIRAGLSASGTEDGAELRFDDERRADALHLSLWGRRLLRRYGIEDRAGQLDAFLTRHPGGVTVGAAVALPAPAFRGWFDPSTDRLKRRYVALARISKRTQLLLRSWMPYVFFSHDGRYGQRRQAYPTIAYAFGKPYYRRSGNDFAYDPMAPEHVRAAARVTPDLLAAAEHLRACFLRDQRRDLGALYRFRTAEKVLREAKPHNQHFLKLLSADKFAMDRLIKFGDVCREVREQVRARTKLSARTLLKRVESVEKAFLTRYRRFDHHEDLTPLGRLLLIEATAVLDRYLGRPVPLEVLFRFTAGGEELLFANRYIDDGTQPV